MGIGYSVWEWFNLSFIVNISDDFFRDKSENSISFFYLFVVVSIEFPNYYYNSHKNYENKPNCGF